jgi:penicillin amidase
VRAGSLHDAFLAQGFVHAQDRLWHMEYDRRRAYGRWAECAGPLALDTDIQMRRFRLEASARADYAAIAPRTREMLDAYAAGVNAFIETTHTLPVEYGLVGARPEPWRPWDSFAVYKVRHVLMGVWQTKAWRGRLVRHLGAERAAQLCPGTPLAPMLIVPPGAEYDGPAADGLCELASMEAALAQVAALLGEPQDGPGLGSPAFEASDEQTCEPQDGPGLGSPAFEASDEIDGGSNNWAVSGRRTASGKPLVAGDPHRPLDVPNVYYQNHLACPEFDAIGLSFPGVPGFPHFGHNAAVAWCVTHTAADYQDLYIERFDPADLRKYRFRDEWRQAETMRETIHVRGAAPRQIDVTVTHHGPVVLGDPASGHAIAFRYTATATPDRTFDALLPMLQARSADELEAAMRSWVDPVNNFVFADVHGAIGYRTRGQVPLRPMANAWVPVPGWDGAHEWQGAIPFEEMPAVRDPATGWVATANSRVAGPEYPHYIGLDYSPDFRTRRLVDRLARLERATVDDMVAMHADRVSLPAREFVRAVRAVRGAAEGEPSQKNPELTHREQRHPEANALDALLAWNGEMSAGSVAATIYAAFRERLMRELMTPILGPLTSEAFAGTARGGVAHMTRLRARLTEMIRRDDRTLLAPGTDWPAALERALHGAIADLTARLGPDVTTWQWSRIHATRPQHTLSAAFPELASVLDPPSVAVGGDGDTVQAASFIASAGYGVTSTSVARYCFDLADWERSGWVVPLGASGHPGSPHYADQAGAWADVRLLPMRYGWERITRDAESHQELWPASGA